MVSSSPVSLGDLPHEILTLVFNQIPQNSDLNRICRVCHRFYEILNPRIWSNLTVGPSSESDDLYNLNIDALHLSLEPSIGLVVRRENLFHAKYLRVATTFHHKLERRCTHPIYDVDRGRSYGCVDERTLAVTNSIGQQLEPIFLSLKLDQLRSFSWNMGICPPSSPDGPFNTSIFGPNGYMTTYQTKLESLSLIVDGNCDWGLDAVEKGYYCLDVFNELRHITWKGLRVRYQFSDLCGILEKNAHHLESLDLDFMKEGVDESRFDPHLQFRRQSGYSPTTYENLLITNGLFQHGCLLMFAMMGWYDGPSAINIYPSLKSLSLSNVSLHNKSQQLTQGIDFSILQSLKLHRCSDSSLLFTQAPPNMKLRILHISLDIFSRAQSPKNVQVNLASFLDKIAGLEELCLLLDPRMETHRFWTHILNHRATLERLVYHERTKSDYNKLADVEPFGKTWHLFPEDSENMPPEGILVELMCETKVEFLALCMKPKNLFSRIQRMTSIPNLKVLHIRAAGDEANEDQSFEDSQYGPSANNPWGKFGIGKADMKHVSRIPGLKDLAQWAFGPSGIPNLKLLAYGDFSYDGRYRGHCFLLCRSTTSVETPDSFRLLQQHDYVLRDGVIREYGDLLGVCPPEPLLDDDPWD